MNEPWSKRHKREFGGLRQSLSNSFADPVSMNELVSLTTARGDMELIHEYHHHSLEYTPNGGSLDLKGDIAALYNSPYITTEDILVTPGAQVALQLASQALATVPGQGHAIVFTPGYQSVVQAPLWSGTTQVTQIRRRAQENWQVNIEAVRAAIRPGVTNYLILNEPYNPAGTLMSRETQQELIDLCKQHNIAIVCDEVYRLLEHDLADRLPSMAEAYPEGGVSLVTMSKPWGACGVTIGWIACPNKQVRQKLWNCQYFGTACPSRASEIQAMMVLRASDTILQERMEIIRDNKARLQKVIEKDYPDLLVWVRPNAGAIAFVRFTGPLTSVELGQILALRGISIKPAYCFGEQPLPDDLASYFRVGFGERQKFPEALDAFVCVMEEFKDEWRATMAQKANNTVLSSS